MSGALIVSGCHTSPKHAVRCAARDSGASVRCCNDGQPDGKAGRCASICFASAGIGIAVADTPLTCIDTYAATVQQAATECAQQGLRLCTVRELAAAGPASCCGTGCKMDHGWAWSSETCVPHVSDADSYAVPARKHNMSTPQSEKASSMPTCPTHFGQPCDLPFRTYDPARGSECAAPPPGESRQSPLVAHCIAGQARTFIEPAVYQSITTNLLHAFGGRTATLLYLKTWSSTAKSASNEFTPELRKDQLVWWGPATQAKLLRALQHIRPQRLRLLHSPGDENVTLNPRCTDKQCMGGGICAYHTPSGVARHLGQIASSSGCLNMIREHEAAHGLRFQYFVRSRPDLAYPVPVPPLCHFASLKGLAFAGRIDWW